MDIQGYPVQLFVQQNKSFRRTFITVPIKQEVPVFMQIINRESPVSRLELLLFTKCLSDVQILEEDLILYSKDPAQSKSINSKRIKLLEGLFLVLCLQRI